MDTTFAVGLGAGVDSADSFEFAKDALSCVSQIAVDLGARRKLCVAGCLAASLLIARKTLDLTDAAQLPKLERRVPKLLKDLERVCAWPEPPDPHNAILRSLISPKGKGTNDRVQQGILTFANSSPYVVGQYFKKLERFSKQVVLTDDDARSSSKANDGSRVTAEEYPAHVNTDLCAILKSHSLCTCLSGRSHGRERHHARLRLRDDIVKVDGHIAFDMLFSASPTTWDHWQDLQLRVSVRKMDAKAVKFNDEDPCKVSASCLKRAAKKTRVVKSEEFCSLVKTRLGSRICCHVQDSELHQLYDGFPVVQDVDSGPELLSQESPRNGTPYYDSPWMESPWTSDSIHFLPESPSDDETLGGRALYASKPYFAVEFKEHDGESVEYCRNFGVIFRYPRLLALCIILLEIGRGQSLLIEDHISVEANLNETWTLAKRLTNKNRTWGDFDYPPYQKAILGCLDYTPSEQEYARIETDAFARKAAIHDAVVQPLEKLLSELGFAGNLRIMDPIDASRGPGQVPDIPAAPAMPTKIREADQSARWLEDLNVVIQYFGKRGSTASIRAPRVAILDTGFDDEAVFFSAPARGREMKGRRDWVAHSETPVDENGHGSHTTAIVTQVAPNATMYVARIAKDRGSLKNAKHAIAEAIEWAANELKADIVSMSFGFQDEVPDITEAITKAILERKGNIIFFAAASNSGGNRREMFPANLDQVISIRETNSRGAFSDSNPPVDPDGPAAFGTLGREVPSAWLSNVEGEVAKSGSSVATAVAAGIAAMLMTVVGVGMADQAVQMPADTRKLWTKRGMQNVLMRMSQNMGNRSYYISPVGFFTGKDAETAWAAIADACAR